MSGNILLPLAAALLSRREAIQKAGGDRTYWLATAWISKGEWTLRLPEPPGSEASAHERLEETSTRKDAEDLALRLLEPLFPAVDAAALRPCLVLTAAVRPERNLEAGVEARLNLLCRRPELRCPVLFERHLDGMDRDDLAELKHGLDPWEDLGPEDLDPCWTSQSLKCGDLADALAGCAQAAKAASPALSRLGGRTGWRFEASADGTSWKNRLDFGAPWTGRTHLSGTCSGSGPEEAARTAIAAARCAGAFEHRHVSKVRLDALSLPDDEAEKLGRMVQDEPSEDGRFEDEQPE